MELICTGIGTVVPVRREYVYEVSLMFFAGLPLVPPGIACTGKFCIVNCCSPHLGQFLILYSSSSVCSYCAHDVHVYIVVRL